MKNQEIKRLVNRHIAKSLSNIEIVCDVPESAKDIFKTGMNNLGRDIEENIFHKVGLGNGKKSL